MQLRRFCPLAFCALLLCVAGTPAMAAQNLLQGWVRFSFPDYTSLHRCTPDNLDRACVAALQPGARTRPTTDLRKEMAVAGADTHPLIFRQADVLHCSEGKCSALHAFPKLVPNMRWLPPQVLVQGKHLFYALPSFTHGQPLMFRLQTFGGSETWSSSPFVTSWLHNYLELRFDSQHPGHLLVEYDWWHTLTDIDNYLDRADELIPLIFVWAGMMLAGTLCAVLLGLLRFCLWRELGYALIAIGLTTAPLILLLDLPWTESLTIPQSGIIALLLYVCLLPLDALLMRRLALRSSLVVDLNRCLLMCGTIKGWVGMITTIGLWLL